MNLVSASTKTINSYTIEEDGSVFVLVRILDGQGNIIQEYLELLGGGDIGGDLERFSTFVNGL